MQSEDDRTGVLFSYYGGKQRIASWICEYIPKHTVYVEPFAGGAAVFFNKPKPIVTNSDHYREVLNDKLDWIVNLYRIASSESTKNEFHKSLELLPYSRKIFEESKKVLKAPENYSDLCVAIAAYYKMNTSFSHILNGGFGTGVYSTNSSIGFMNKVSALPKVLERLRGITIEHDDAINVIKRWDSPQTFFYCDPPYVGTEQGHYSGYTTEEYKELINVLSNIQGSMLLSHYDHPDIEYPKTWERFEKSTICSAKRRVGYDRSKKIDESGQNRSRVEILLRKIANEPREEIKDLYRTGNYDCFPGPGWDGDPGSSGSQLSLFDGI